MLNGIDQNITRFARLGYQLDRLNVYLIYILAFVIPISPAGINICFYTLLASFLFSGRWKEKWQRISASVLSQAALLLYLMIFVSMVYTTADFISAVAVASKFNKLLLIPIVIDTIRTPEQFRTCIKNFLAAMLFTLLVGYIKFYIGLPKVLAGYRFYPSPATPFIHHIQTNMLMALSAFFWVYMSFRKSVRSQQWRFLYIFIMLLTVHYVLFMNIGRSGYLVLGALTPVLACIFLRERQWKRALGSSLFLVAAFFTAAHFSSVFQNRIADAHTDVVTYNQDQKTSIGARIDFYRDTVWIIVQHPFLGTGIGGFAEAYSQKAQQLKVATLTNNPHNQYLDTASQLGMVGLILLVWLYVASGWCRNRECELKNLWGLGICITLMVGSLFNSWLMDLHAGFIFCLFSSLTTRLTR